MKDKIIEEARRLRKLVAEHEKWRTKRSLNLVASENFSSPDARSFLSSDLSNRYTARDHFYRGTKFIDDIEALATETGKKLFSAKYADVRPISGHTCSLVLFLTFLESGNSIVTCPPKHGGYPGSSELGLGKLMHLNTLHFPFDASAMNIIPAKTKSLLQKKRPEMTIFGSSFIPFPYDIKGSVPPEYDGITAYDGSHVMGLIAGGEFQRPLDEGCDVMIGSTHKSFFGPQGGIILSNNDEVFSKIDAKIYPGIIDNIHWNRVASLAFSMLELRKFGKQYAKQVISNSKTLAKTLDQLNVPVKCGRVGYTRSHQVLLGFDKIKAAAVADSLQRADIITDVGIRLGTSEVTRHGMKEPEMESIASLISECLKKGAALDKIARDVHRLASAFEEIEFTLY